MIASTYQWDFSIVYEVAGSIGNGLLVTLELTVLTCVFGTIIAVPLAVALRSRSAIIRMPAMLFVEIGKGIPLLALLIWFHLAVPIWLGLSFSAFWNATIAFTISLSAFLADILRGGIEAIPEGHIEAAKALGFDRFSVLRRVTVPETVRRSLAGISAMYITTLKLSTLASTIGVAELLFNIRVVNSVNPHPMELYTALSLIFLALVIPTSYFARKLEVHPWFAIAPTNHR